MAIKHAEAPRNAPSWDETLDGKYVTERKRQRSGVLQQHVRIQRERRAGFRLKYDQYMESDEWRSRRNKVLKRAGGTCEGCLERPATQVHHLNYRRLGEEMLFDLVAVCDECHAICHPPEEEDESEAA